MKDDDGNYSGKLSQSSYTLTSDTTGCSATVKNIDSTNTAGIIYLTIPANTATTNRTIVFKYGTVSLFTVVQQKPSSVKTTITFRIGGFSGSNTLSNDTLLTSSGDGCSVKIYYTNSNTASTMMYSASQTGYYIISYNGKNLFRLNVIANTITNTYNLNLSLINLSTVSVSDNISYIAIFTKNIGNFNVQGTVIFHLIQVTVYNHYIFFCYSPNYILTYKRYTDSGITYKSGTNYSKSTYGNCYLVDITNEVEYTDTTGYNKESITYTNTYYIQI